MALYTIVFNDGFICGIGQFTVRVLNCIVATQTFLGEYSCIAALILVSIVAGGAIHVAVDKAFAALQ